MISTRSNYGCDCLTSPEVIPINTSNCLIVCCVTRRAVSIDRVMNQQIFGRPFYTTDNYRMFDISCVAIAIADEIQSSS